MESTVHLQFALIYQKHLSVTPTNYFIDLQQRRRKKQYKVIKVTNKQTPFVFTLIIGKKENINPLQTFFVIIAGPELWFCKLGGG